MAHLFAPLANVAHTHWIYSNVEHFIAISERGEECGVCHEFSIDQLLVDKLKERKRFFLENETNGRSRPEKVRRKASVDGRGQDH